MDTFALPGQGLVIPGHLAAPSAARAWAAGWLRGQGADEWDAETETEGVRCLRLYWDAAIAPGELSDGEDGQPVTVVRLRRIFNQPAEQPATQPGAAVLPPELVREG